MKLASYRHEDENHIGIVHENQLFSISSGENVIALDMLDYLRKGDASKQIASDILRTILSGDSRIEGTPISDVIFLAPLPTPTSCRDAYAFRQHVATARRNRGAKMAPEFDQFPIFYFTNHNAIQGPFDDIVCMPDHFQQLDFELEVAVVIGKRGKNIKAKDADQFIAGFCIMNDLSARQLQMEEMKLNLGPAKGKDFSTVIGPYLVTPKDLKEYAVSAKRGHIGNNYDLTMKCWLNNELVSEGNMKDMDWTFAEIIERCSYGTDIYPGDVIGSGTVGTGCLLELNGTARLKDGNHKDVWLKRNDIVEMEVTGLGRISNRIVADQSSFSILEIKHEV